MVVAVVVAVASVAADVDNVASMLVHAALLTAVVHYVRVDVVSKAADPREDPSSLILPL